MVKKYLFLPDLNALDVGKNVCQVDLGASKGKLTLNGKYSSNGEVSFIKRGYSSNVSIFSGTDLSNVSFTIHGIFQGLMVSETILGAKQLIAPSHSNKLFDVITSIVIDKDIATSFTIGSDHDIAVVLKNSKLGNESSATWFASFTSVSNNQWEWFREYFNIFGIRGSNELQLTVVNLTLKTKPVDFFQIAPFSNIGSDAAHAGVSFNSQYPFEAVVAYFAGIGFKRQGFSIELAQF
jgi:hypothetical protein